MDVVAAIKLRSARARLFLLGNAVFLIVPVVAGLAGFLDFRQLGFTIPTFLGFASGIVFGVFCVSLTYYPMNFVISKRKIGISLVQTARNSFLQMIPFLLFGALVEELFFRGFLVSIFLPFGSVLAIAISSLAHYFAHFLNPGFRVFEKTADKMLAASGWFLVTILLGFLFIYSESLAPVIIAHSLASIGFGWTITFRSYACADKSFASHLHAETQPSIPVSYAGYVSTRTDLLRAEQATANVHAYMLMEIRRKTILW